MRSHLRTFLLLAFTLPHLAQAEPGDTVYQHGYLTKEESLKAIEVPEGYALQLVLSEPDIKEPVAIAWDGNGALYVVEMRTYMQDIDAGGERQPTSRISRHEDTNGDGIYDKHSIFIDNLMLPRMVLPLDDRVMVGITDTLDLWNYRDTDHDGVADEKTLVYEGGGRGGNMEHQPSGLIWGRDNWIYLTYEAVRYRFTGEKFISERLPKGGGQWGLTEDDDGRLFYSTAGGENPAFYFQQPPAYGMIDVGGQTENDFQRVFPLAAVPDVQGGRGRVGPNGGLASFTGCAGQSIYRGDALPTDLYGDLIIPEPVGRLVRRAKVEHRDGKLVLNNAYPGSEFLRSRDVNFRPLNSATGPDGALYIVDMHRGIIQQGNWVAPGSYLRPVVEKWGLDKNIGRGRIYRLVYKDHPITSEKPAMLEETTAALVAHLASPNGWWRDTARKLLILRPDATSVVPALHSLARNGKSPLARAEALWTLEGIGKVDPGIVADALGDTDPHVRMAAIRVAEPLIHSGDLTILTKTQSLAMEKDSEAAIQILNSLAAAGSVDPAVVRVQDALLAAYAENDLVKANAAQREEMAAERQRIALQRLRDAKFADYMEKGSVIYQQLCFTCHGQDGKGMHIPDQEITLAPSLVGSPRVLGAGGSLARVILHGMGGPLDGKSYPNIMVPMVANGDAWVASVATYVRNSFGNNGGFLDESFVTTTRERAGNRTTPWTEAELEALEPPVLPNRSEWKLTASHGQLDVREAVDGNRGSRWATNTPQVPGMWFQIELPSQATINRIILDAAGSDRDYPRGYEVTLSDDGKTWSKPVASGIGAGAVTDIIFPAETARFLRITDTGQVNGLFWSIHEVTLYGKPAP